MSFQAWEPSAQRAPHLPPLEVSLIHEWELHITSLPNFNLPSKAVTTESQTEDAYISPDVLLHDNKASGSANFETDADSQADGGRGGKLLQLGELATFIGGQTRWRLREEEEEEEESLLQLEERSGAVSARMKSTACGTLRNRAVFKCETFSLFFRLSHFRLTFSSLSDLSA